MPTGSRSRPAGQRGTSCRRWRSPTRCGIGAPRSSSSGGERAEAELVPAAGYPFHELQVRGLDRRNPLKAARAAGLAGAARRCARAGCCSEIGADAVMGGGGYVAGPVGLAARSLGCRSC